MQNNDFLFSQDIYTQRLAVIENINFTSREIDVMACLLNARGTNKIASLLSVAPNTVLAHVRNVMVKLECNSREGIIDFIERSHKLLLFKTHYANLRMTATFEKTLRDIAKLKKQATPVCLIVHEKNEDLKNALIKQLKNHLKQVEVSAEIRKESTDRGTEGLNTKDIILLFFSKNEDREEALNTDFINLEHQENYFFAFFEILTRLLPTVDIKPIIFEFKETYGRLNSSIEIPLSQSLDSPVPEQSPSGKTREPILIQLQYTLRKKWRQLVISAFLVVALFGIWFLTYLHKQDHPQSQPTQATASIQSELSIPTESALLNRFELIAQINDKFKGQNGIQTVALVGLGGAGKSTLARQYARIQRASLVWQINAETSDSLKHSFENLAHALIRTEEDKKTLRSIEDINNAREKDEKEIQFVRERLKSQPTWLLIYDNVVKFTDIQPYFPHDANVWGNGKIILTTQDATIQNNTHVNHVIQIGELDQNQKFNLFLKIITHGNTHPLALAQNEEAKKFLNEIPSFPLDVVLAAYYLKATHVSYDKYLEHLGRGDRDFENVQENLLKEAGAYTKTRYRIITLSLKQIMDAHPDFKDLLLLVSLLDSQKIPRGLLDLFKNEHVVDNFIYHLKKYSLIKEDTPSSIVANPTFSTHRATQQVARNYVMKALSLNQDHPLLQHVSDTLDQYTNQAIEKEDLLTMEQLANHYEKALQRKVLLNDKTIETLKSGLGCLYFYRGDLAKAKTMLEETDTNSAKSSPYRTRSLVHLGLIYRDSGEYKKAHDLLERSLLLYKKESPQNPIKIAQSLAYLASIEGALGHYERSKNLLEQSLLIYKKNQSSPHHTIAWVLAALGNVYREFSDYEKAKDVLEQSLRLYKEKYPENHVSIAWVLALLGNVHRSLGQYEKAKNYLEQSLLLYKKIYPETHVSVAWVSTHLGNTYTKLGHYERAKQLLEQSLVVHNNYFGKNHPNTGWVLIHLGNTYRKLRSDEKAHVCFEKVVSIIKNQHLGMAWSMAQLGEFYQEQGQPQKAKGLFEAYLLFYQKSPSEKDTKTARGLRDVAHIYLLADHQDAAEEHLRKALTLIQANNSPDIVLIFESLADLYLQKVQDEEKKGNVPQAQIYKTQEIHNLKQALKNAKLHFPEGHPFVKRIQEKLKNLGGSEWSTGKEQR